MVKYTCSPVLEGKVYTAVGLVMVAVAVASAVVGGHDALTGCVFGGLCFAVLAGVGVYYWKFRRRPLRREIVVGTWYNPSTCAAVGCSCLPRRALACLLTSSVCSS